MTNLFTLKGLTLSLSFPTYWPQKIWFLPFAPSFSSCSSCSFFFSSSSSSSSAFIFAVLQLLLQSGIVALWALCCQTFEDYQLCTCFAITFSHLLLIFLFVPLIIRSSPSFRARYKWAFESFTAIQVSISFLLFLISIFCSVFIFGGHFYCRKSMVRRERERERESKERGVSEKESK